MDTSKQETIWRMKMYYLILTTEALNAHIGVIGSNFHGKVKLSGNSKTMEKRKLKAEEKGILARVLSFSSDDAAIQYVTETTEYLIAGTDKVNFNHPVHYI